MADSDMVFGTFTIADWKVLRVKIKENQEDQTYPNEALKLLEKRLDTRYFEPIRKILDMEKEAGEGFAVMTLICSLIEFLQTCREGKIYEYGLNDDTKFYYGKGNKKFISFLTEQEPFKSEFKKDLPLKDKAKRINTVADHFYANVRCGLLHEAATNGGWLIRSGTEKFVDVDKKIIYREKFNEAMHEYFESYRSEVLNGGDAQQLRYGLYRKLDSLCEILEDKSKKWWD